MSLTFDVEPFHFILKDLPRLFSLHWAELGSHDELEPDWARFAQMQSMGSLKCITARADGKLVGYFFAAVAPSLHYKSLLCAWSDGFFLEVEYRKGLNGVNMLKYAQNYLCGIGVKRVYLVGRVTDDLDKLFVRLGYEPFERVYKQDF